MLEYSKLTSANLNVRYLAPLTTLIRILIALNFVLYSIFRNIDFLLSQTPGFVKKCSVPLLCLQAAKGYWTEYFEFVAKFPC